MKTLNTSLVLLFSLILITQIPIEVLAQQEMEPEWTIENGNQYTKLVTSADGKYLAAAANNASKLHMFQGNESLWNSSVNRINSLAMSADGKYVAVGAEKKFYLFNIQNSTPTVEYPLGYENSLTAISTDGDITIVGTSQHTNISNAETKLHLFEKQKTTPTWNTTISGSLESLSLSDDGNHIVVSTSKPGILYLFARDSATPLWTYNFGERCGGAKISSNGNYIVAVGGNQSDKSMRIYRFLRQTPTPNYIKIISELPSSSRLTVSENGSIFAISYSKTNRLLMFNLELPPYGYGPGSVLNESLAAPSVSIAMSTDGKHIIAATVEGIFAYDYLNQQLNLHKQYTNNRPFINDATISRDGHYIFATIATFLQDSKNSAIYFFDNFREQQTSTISPQLQIIPTLTIAAALTAAAYIFLRKKPTHKERILRFQ